MALSRAHALYHTLRPFRDSFLGDGSGSDTPARNYDGGVAGGHPVSRGPQTSRAEMTRLALSRAPMPTVNARWADSLYF